MTQIYVHDFIRTKFLLRIFLNNWLIFINVLNQP